MSQQGGSSIISSGIPNSEVKYQKALKQISKLINTNKILKGQCEERQQILSAQLNDIAMRCEELQKKYEQSEHEKLQMKEFMQELQDTNQDLRKEYQTLERQVGYLNDVLTEQNAELKKLSVFKNEKGISELFKSYEEREENYRNEVSRLEEQVIQLKNTIDKIEDDLVQETQMRQRYEDQYNIVGLEINKYRELNNYLMDKNQHILGEERNKGERNGANQHQIESLVLDMKRQLQSLRNLKYENEDLSEKQYIKNYELLLEEKNNLALELAKCKDQLIVSESRIKEMYDFEQKMSTAIARSDILIEENNILKNRITILESKELLDNAGFDDDSEIKVIEDKINFMMSKNDPAMTIKNGDDNSHFMKMKSFITDLQVKLNSVIQQKVSIQKKHKSLKLKFNKKAEENIILEQGNKLLKGKLQGFERLTQKLNYELQRSMQAHEDEIVKMVAITNNLVGKKVQESKTASQFIKSQFDIEIQKAERAEKSLSQELQTYKLQNGSLKIKLSDIQEKHRQSLELNEIIQGKVGELKIRVKEMQKENFEVRERAIRYEQLYEQEKAFHESVLLQKQSVSQQLNMLSEQVNEKSYTWQQSIKQQQDNYESQIKRSRAQLIRLTQQVSLLKEDNKRLSFQLEQYRMRENKNLSGVKQENVYLKDIEAKYQETKQLCHFMENELIVVKNKLAQTESFQSRYEQLQALVLKANNDLNDQKRANIQQKNQIQTFALNNTYLKQQNQQLLNDVAQLKNKIYQPPTVSLSTTKELQARKQIQQLHQEIALLQSSVRDQKRNSARYNNQLEHYKQQVQTLEDVINKSKLKEKTLVDNISSLTHQLNTAQDQIFQYKARYNQSAATSDNLTSELQKSTQKIVQLTEQISIHKTKLNKSQTTYENLMRDLNGTKYYLKQAEKMIKRLNLIDRLDWEQQREKDNLISLVETLNRIIKNSENLQLSNNSSNQQYSFVPSSSFGNYQTNFNSQGSNRVTLERSSGSDGQGKNLVTNDSFRLTGTSIYEFQPNVNLSSESFGRPSQAGLSYSPYEEA